MDIYPKEKVPHGVGSMHMRIFRSKVQVLGLMFLFSGIVSKIIGGSVIDG